MALIIANHTVKPSSPTPLQFKNHKLSFLDQIATPIYIPLIFFYQSDPSQDYEAISKRLRQSLSEILTIFYPLAGTIRQNSFVDCDDKGAEFLEARVHGRLAQFIKNPKMEELKTLLPVDSSSYSATAVQLLVQLSRFDCGGVAVGVCFPHKIGDAASFVGFMNAWAAACRGEEASRIFHPSFDMSLHFPRKYFLSFASRFRPGFTKEKIVTRRLVFDREKIEKLRREAAAASRVEAVTAFIWRSFMAANYNSDGGGGGLSFAATHMVNLRPRRNPPIPDQTLGNGVSFAMAVASPEEDGCACMSKLRAAIRAVDGDYIDRTTNSVIHFLRELYRLRRVCDAGNCVFTSWSRFPVYEVDFGWGRPVWAATATMPYRNLVVLMSTPSQDGIEAWINVPDDDFFQMFEANYNNLFN